MLVQQFAAAGREDEKSTGCTNNPPDNGTADVVEQAEAVKASLREAASKTTRLITALKRHRKQAKAVQCTLAALKQLQNIDA